MEITHAWFFPYFLAEETSANRKSESRQNQDKISAKTLGIKRAKRSERASIKAFLASIKSSHINLSENVGRSEDVWREAEDGKRKAESGKRKAESGKRKDKTLER